MNETIKLNLIPKGEIQKIHVSQFDNKRKFSIELYNGETPYNIDEGIEVSITMRKVDSKLVTITPEYINENVIIFNTTQQFTACSGINVCTLDITDNNGFNISSLYFWVIVQRCVSASGIASDSDINNLTTQINAIASEEITEIAPDIVQREASDYINRMGGRWALFTGLISEDHVDVLGYGINDNCIFDVYSQTYGIVITKVEYIGESIHEHYGIVRVYYDTSTFTSSSEKFYLRYFDIGNF